MSEKTLREALEEAYRAIGKDPKRAIDGKKNKKRNKKKKFYRN